MLQYELEERIGRPLHISEWDYLHMVYQYSPQIPDVGGKEELVRLMGEMNGIYRIAAEARAIADAAGWQPVTYTEVEWWGEYDVCDHRRIAERPHTIRAVQEYVHAGLLQYGRDNNLAGSSEQYYDFGMEYFTPASRVDEMQSWPINAHWVAVYAVTGGSEGYYVHVDAVNGDKREMLLLGKTLQSMEHAQLIVAVVSKLLHV